MKFDVPLTTTVKPRRKGDAGMAHVCALIAQYNEVVGRAYGTPTPNADDGAIGCPLDDPRA
jgi:hypothetical protein